MSLLLPETTTTAAARRVIVRSAHACPDGAGREIPSLTGAPPATTGITLLAERLDPADAARWRDAWVDLMGRALEPNAFLDPDFALPAAQHLGASRRPAFLLVWADDGAGARILVAVCSIIGGRGPFRASASPWFHDLSALGGPLLDCQHAAAALDAVLGWFETAVPRARAILFRAVPAEGPTAQMLRAVAARGRPVVTIAAWGRAVLRRDGSRDGAGLAALSAKGAKELRRQRRRLSECGTLGYASAETEDDLRAAMERFLALEAGGWKGRAGTALLARPGQTAFARTATRLLSRRGLCRIDSLTLDGEPVAMGIVLTAGRTDSLWKIAYREDLARFSPGVQFVLDFTGRQRDRGGAADTDSCAMPHHRMIDRLWRDRLALVDVAVSARPGDSRAFRLAVWAERRARALRAMAKSARAAWIQLRSGAGPRSPG